MVDITSIKNTINALFARFSASRHVVRTNLLLGKPRSEQYWIDRYKHTGTSGRGSYSHLAEFKANVINAFISERQIRSVVEFGFGDGNQLRYFQIPFYRGYEISPEMVSRMNVRYKNDPTKSFHLLARHSARKAELSLSLDVIYHLIEDDVFHDHMNMLFEATKKYVIIYSSNFDQKTKRHVRHRKFSDWIAENRPEFKKIQIINNKYPVETQERRMGSPASFFVYSEKH